MEIQRKPIVDLNKIKDSLQDPGGNVPRSQFKAINAAGVGARAAVVSQTAGKSRLVITSTAIGL